MKKTYRKPTVRRNELRVSDSLMHTSNIGIGGEGFFDVRSENSYEDDGSSVANDVWGQDW
ncbi:MAG: hypothetical protein MJZ60_03760 [Bacteroidaceae bacterium]|nr:hypothetical protein [Bacteroidaceae bacterium]